MAQTTVAYGLWVAPPAELEEEISHSRYNQITRNELYEELPIILTILTWSHHIR